VHLLDKDLEKHIIECNTCQHGGKIPGQLHPSSQVAFAENEVAAVIKTYGKSKEKRDDHRGDVWAYCKTSEMKHAIRGEFFLENVKEKYIEYCIATTTSRIPEGLQRHKPFEQWVKKINNAKNEILHVPVFLNGRRR